MNYLSREKRVFILACLCNGMSGRAAGRLLGVSKITVRKLLADVNEICDGEYRDERINPNEHLDHLGPDHFFAYYFIADTWLHYFHHNYSRIHSPQMVTNAMAVGASQNPVSLTDLIKILEFVEKCREEDLGPRRTRR